MFGLSEAAPDAGVDRLTATVPAIASAVVKASTSRPAMCGHGLHDLQGREQDVVDKMNEPQLVNNNGLPAPSGPPWP
jgi:hypothetical protein